MTSVCVLHRNTLSLSLSSFGPNLQTQLDKLEAKFLKERAALDANYQKLFLIQRQEMQLMFHSKDKSPEGESMFTWVGRIEGRKATLAEGFSYKLLLHFPADYSFKPPVVKFETLLPSKY